MCEGKGRQRFVVIGKFCKLAHQLHKLCLYKLQSLCHYYDIGVVADVARGRSEMDYSLCGRAVCAELMDMSHDIVPYLFFFLFGILIVDIIDICTHFSQLLIGYMESQLLFRFCQRDPQPAPRCKLFIRGKQILHFPARISRAKRTLIGAVIHKLKPPVSDQRSRKSLR